MPTPDTPGAPDPTTDHERNAVVIDRGSLTELLEAAERVHTILDLSTGGHDALADAITTAKQALLTPHPLATPYADYALGTVLEAVLDEQTAVEAAYQQHDVDADTAAELRGKLRGYNRAISIILAETPVAETLTPERELEALKTAIQTIGSEQTTVENNHPPHAEPGTSEEAALHGNWRALTTALDILQTEKTARLEGTHEAPSAQEAARDAE